MYSAGMLRSRSPEFGRFKHCPYHTDRQCAFSIARIEGADDLYLEGLSRPSMRT
jgi:hypothetical protein